MSRIGRNYLEVGMYTEITFPQNNVRFIAINSGVDSANQQDNEFVPFVNIINEYYVRDGSKKVRTSLQLKGESGEHLTTIPPYGYVKDTDNSEHWLVDPEAAQVVKRIFSLCMDGNGPTQIARMLKEDHMLRPGKAKIGAACVSLRFCWLCYCSCWSAPRQRRYQRLMMPVYQYRQAAVLERDAASPLAFRRFRVQAPTLMEKPQRIGS